MRSTVPCIQNEELTGLPRSSAQKLIQTHRLNRPGAQKSGVDFLTVVYFANLGAQEPYSARAAKVCAARTLENPRQVGTWISA